MKYEVLLGLSKLLEKQAKLAREHVEAGEYDLDETVHLHICGTLDVGEDTQTTPTHKIPWKAAFALFLHKAGLREERVVELLADAIREALEAGDDVAEAVDALADLEEAEALVQAGLDSLPKEPRRGAVSVKELDYVEVKPSKKAA